MATRALVSVEEYLSTVYEPDVDYVEGELIERNMGEPGHGSVQGAAYAALRARINGRGFSALLETRVQVHSERFRIPDICLIRGKVPRSKALIEPPLLCVEILSPEDRMSRVQPRIQDFLKMGVPCVWVIDPESKAAWMYYPDRPVRDAADGMLRLDDPPIEIPLAELFDEE